MVRRRPGLLRDGRIAAAADAAADARSRRRRRRRGRMSQRGRCPARAPVRVRAAWAVTAALRRRAPPDNSSARGSRMTARARVRVRAQQARLPGNGAAGPVITAPGRAAAGPACPSPARARAAAARGRAAATRSSPRPARWGAVRLACGGAARGVQCDAPTQPHPLDCTSRPRHPHGVASSAMWQSGKVERASERMMTAVVRASPRPGVAGASTQAACPPLPDSTRIVAALESLSGRVPPYERATGRGTVDSGSPET